LYGPFLLSVLAIISLLAFFRFISTQSSFEKCNEALSRLVSLTICWIESVVVEIQIIIFRKGHFRESHSI